MGMWFRSMSAQATLLTGTLLLLAMLLVDSVVSALWYYQAAQARLARMQDHLAWTAVSLEEGRRSFSAALADLPQGSAFCLYLLSGTRHILEKTCLPPARFTSHSGAGITALAPEKALHASRLLSTDTHSLPLTLVATERPGATVWHQLLHAQTFVLGYIALYLVVLTTLAWFSHFRRIQRPLEQLVATAESVFDPDTQPFPEQQQLGELHRLSYNLNTMLRRLEKNRTDLKAAAAELTEKNRQLLASQEEMIRTEKLAATGRLAAGMAHEIGNPLGVVQGYLELLQMDCTAQERQEYIANALQEARRMHSLISTMLQTARGQSGLAVERINVNRVLAEFTEAMRPQAVLKGIVLQLRPEAEHAAVNASADALRQILLNGLLNAADAIRSTGAASGEITLSTCEVQQNGVRLLDLCMTDTGPGLSSEAEDRIFDPFFTTKAPGSGTGLGMSVSLSLVEAMGGTMQASNRAGGGMELHVFLPLAGTNDREEDSDSPVLEQQEAA